MRSLGKKSTAISLRSIRQRAYGLLDRARKRIHRASYWKALTQRFPINGLSPEEVGDLIPGLPTMAHNQSASTVALPGLQVFRNRVYYWNHPLATLPADDANVLSNVLKTIATPDKHLVSKGLAVSIAAQVTTSDRALVLSPHQDDAALSLGGTIVARREIQSHLICNVFTVSGWLGKGFHTSPLADVTYIRQAEEELSNQILGSQSLGLGLWEAEVRNYYRRAIDNYPVREGFVFARDPLLRTMGEHDSILNGFSRIIAAIQPSRIYFPLGLGSHMDHVYLARFGFEQLTQLPSCQLYFYEDQPYATYENVDIEAAISSHCSESIQLTAEYQNITDFFETKIQAIAAHRSQFSRDENESRLRNHAQALARESGLPNGSLAERIWKVQIQCA